METLTIPTPDEILEMNRERFGEEMEDLADTTYCLGIARIISRGRNGDKSRNRLQKSCSLTGSRQTVRKPGLVSYRWLEEETGQLLHGIWEI